MIEKPRWWAECENIKKSLEIPDYEPPRFEDGTYTYEIVPIIENQYDCMIQFRGVDTNYSDDWEVRIEREKVMPIGRHRDERGNTVFEMSAESFGKKMDNLFD